MRIQREIIMYPKITADHIESIIVDEIYWHPSRPQGGTLTICILYLSNGFQVTGESACVYPENFEGELGKKIARKDAISKIWMLEGYLLAARRAGVGI